MEDYKETVSTSQSSGNFLENSTYQRRFLEFFEPSRRSYVTNLFCYAVRSGHKTLQSIIAYVKDNAARCYVDVPQIIDQDRQAAEDFARYILHWESLTSAEKKAIREEKSTIYMQGYLKKQPSTEKQLRFLRSLDYQGAVENKLDATRIIDELRKRRNENDTE